MLLFCVPLNRYADAALPHILRRVVGYWGGGEAAGATAGALCQARYRPDARPVQREGCDESRQEHAPDRQSRPPCMAQDTLVAVE